MADLDDMNATPMSKLPPPVMQSKQGMPTLESPSYQDLLQDTERHRPGAAPLPAAAPLTAPPMHSQQPASDAMTAQQYQYMMHMMQLQHQAAAQASAQAPAQASAHAPAQAAAHAPLPPPPPQSWLVTHVRHHRMFLSVCVVVFVLLMFVIPRLARVARFATFDGKLNLMGTAAASVIAASLVGVTSLVYPNPA
jgi:hypothetical protein